MASQKKRLTVLDVINAIDGDDSELSELDDGSDNDEESDFDEPDEDDSDGDEDEDGFSSDEDVPLSTFAGTGTGRKNTGQASDAVWKKQNYVPPDHTFTGSALTVPIAVKSPYEYFREFITDEMLDAVCESTNLYSVQKKGKSVNMNRKELQQLIGMFFRMGIVKMNGVRTYWETETRLPMVADVMSRDRFRLLLTVLHFVDNNEPPDDTNKDKVWKIRPWLNALRDNCLAVEPEEHNSIDEMMVPFKGKYSSIRQYIKNKPHKWGLKIWVRASVSGIVLDFDVYQGSGGKASELGVGGDVIVKLSETLPKNQNFKVTADNLFSSVGLVRKMSSMGMYYIGTMRKNRLKGCPLMSDKELEKKPRGSYDVQVETNMNAAMVKWYDNRCVTVISSYCAADPTDEVERWDKKQNKFVKVVRPAAIKIYNESMGGVDLVDSCISLHKYNLKSRRWYLYLFWHSLMIAEVNAWQLYRRDCRLLGIPRKEIMRHRKFQAAVAQSLIMVNAERKRGRPLDDEKSPQPPKVIRKAPVSDVQKDRYAHWPVKLEKRGRCKNCSDGYTDTACEKCNVRLCFNAKKNCFKVFHT